MLWRKVVSGQSFREWLNVAIPGPRISQGQKLDPFTTSLRNLKNVGGWLQELNSGQRLEARGGTGQQNVTDLRSAELMNREGETLTELGRNTLQAWITSNANDNTDEHELSRCIVMIGQALRLQVQSYINYYSFWNEVREVYQPVEAIKTPELLYLVSVLNSDCADFNPWKIISKLRLTFDLNENLGGLGAAFENINEGERAKLETLGTWLGGWRTRSSGRQKFCTALELLSRDEAGRRELLELTEVQAIVGINNTQIESLISLCSEYSSRLNLRLEAEYCGPSNLILYGPPGSGKSYMAKQMRGSSPSETVTFHPGYDNQSFTGFYKPITKEVREGEHTKLQVVYEFVPQVFAKIYVKAWSSLNQNQILVIEEINRGNCAKIFGDIFQLLDRDSSGNSAYFIFADPDFAAYLKQSLHGTDYEQKIKEVYHAITSRELEDPYSVLILPKNLHIVATMNTSDQSLFPMDSAFKRRWSWKYVPIDYADAALFTIVVEDKKYAWSSFLKIVNEMIYKISESEDKQIGNRFVSTADHIITEETFINKVLFYLWNDVYKEEDPGDDNYFFKYQDSGNTVHVKFSDLFKENSSQEIIKILTFVGVEER